MEIIKNNITSSLNITTYFNNPNVCFLDIETTGLNRNNSIIYLVGILYFNTDNNTWKLKQLFTNTIEKEKQLLEVLLNCISDFDLIITYNGESFDLPFIERRLEYHNIDYSFDLSKSIDIYRIVRKEKHLLNLPNLRLKTIEECLGFHREDIYSGKDCIGFYYDYINTGEVELKDRVIKHNYDDLAYMLDIMKILDVINDKKSFYFNIWDSEYKFTIENISITGDRLSITGSTYEKLNSNIKYYSDNIIIDSDDLHRFNISIEFKRGYITKEKKCIYIDLSGFSYVNNIKDKSGYNLPPTILVLMVENNYIVDNVKNFIKMQIENIV